MNLTGDTLIALRLFSVSIFCLWRMEEWLWLWQAHSLFNKKNFLLKLIFIKFKHYFLPSFPPPHGDIRSVSMYILISIEKHLPVCFPFLKSVGSLIRLCLIPFYFFRRKGLGIHCKVLHPDMDNKHCTNVLATVGTPQTTQFFSA